MKLYEVLIEAKQIDEAPMGMLKTLGNKAMSKMGSAKATGKLSTGGLANQLHKEFQQYLGKTGREATKDAVMGFLSSKGYPTRGAATIINTALKGAGPAPAGPLANMKATAKGLAGQARDAMVKGAGNLADKMKPGLKAAPINNTEPTMNPSYGKGNPEDTKATVAKMTDAQLAKFANRTDLDPANPHVKIARDELARRSGGDDTPTTTGPADTTAAAPTKTGSFNNQTGGGKANYSMSTGFDPKTMKNTSVPMDADAVPDPKKKKVAVSASKINTGDMVAEAGPGVLPQSIIDKAILKAAQEAEIMNTKQGKTSAQQTTSANLAGGAPTDTDGDGNIDATYNTKSSSGDGFGAGLKKGFTGKAKPSPDIAGLEQRIAAIEKKVGLA
jgi:hypothetical protein